MNLREFIDYRKDCVICGNPLITHLHSQRQQTIRMEEGRLMVVFDLNPLKAKQKQYKVGYSFGLDDHSWYLEFYTKNDIRFDNESPNFLIDRFKELDKNLLEYKFHRLCKNCNCHCYDSNSFFLQKPTATTGPLEIAREYFGISVPYDEGYKVYRVLNRYDKKSCLLAYGRQSAAFGFEAAGATSPSTPFAQIEIPLIPFTEKREVAERLNKLLTFS